MVMTVSKIELNPSVTDTRFTMPAVEKKPAAAAPEKKPESPAKPPQQ
jgi:hypothetical protein